ncbi:MAG: LysR substrate-binding domain-containing protein [Myxococcota bacterium]
MSSSLPPLNAVRVFECVARHGSFARAAGELFVTQSAVSKQIALLEDYVGSRLFERHSSGVSLTLEGRELKHALLPAFETLRASFQRYSRRPPRSSTFKLTTVASFASEFLIPRLAEFERDFPELSLELSTTDRLLDFDREEIDLSVRYGTGDWPGLEVEAFGPSTLIPVRHADPPPNWSPRRVESTLSDVWQMWPEAPSSPLPPVMMEHFAVALAAVRSGYGIAALPELLVRDDLERGSLVALGDPKPWEMSFFLVRRAGRPHHPRIPMVMTWLQQHAA